MPVTNPNKAEQCALQLLDTCGIDDPTDIPLPNLICGLGAFYEEKPLKFCDGRIVSYQDSTLITLNSSINNAGKKRYAQAHEIGHYVMHRTQIPIISDTEDNFVDWLKGGEHEQEANEFAAEFLMPRHMFHNFCAGQRISPELIRKLSERFQTSLTSTILRYVNFGTHEVCVVYVKDNNMKWWKKSADFYPFLKFKYNAPPPTGSVAYEMFTKGSFYSDRDQKQQVWRSDWFQMNERDVDTPFFEFCLYVPSYNYTISMIWEEKRR